MDSGKKAAYNLGEPGVEGMPSIIPLHFETHISDLDRKPAHDQPERNGYRTR